MASTCTSVFSVRSSVSACFKAGKAHMRHQRISRPLAVAPAAVRKVMSGASQSYPQKVRLDEGKAKAADLQSEQSKAQGGETKPGDAASKARSAASQSQHVVNMLTAEDPVSASDVSELSKKEAEVTGGTQKGGAAAQAQSAATKLKEVANRKIADQDLINQKDAAEITSAESKLHGGQTPPNSISSKAQSAADMADQAGLAKKAEQ